MQRNDRDAGGRKKRGLKKEQRKRGEEVNDVEIGREQKEEAGVEGFRFLISNYRVMTVHYNPSFLAQTLCLD